MPKIKQISPDDRVVPNLGDRLVLAGAVVDCPAGEVYSYTCQASIWAPADAAAQAEHDAAIAPPVEDAPELEGQDS